MDKLKFGDFIYKRRKELGLSQEILGVKLGVTNKAVSKWETGETLPDVQLMEHLANVLGVTLDDLYHQTDTPKKENKKFNLVLTISIILAIIVIILSSILLSSYLKRQSQIDNQVNITLSLENYNDYVSLTPCNKSEIDEQTLTIFGNVSLNDEIISYQDVNIKLEYDLHMYYESTSGEESLYVFINRQKDISINEKITYFEFTFVPTKVIQDYKQFKSFDFSYRVSSISGNISLKEVTYEQ